MDAAGVTTCDDSRTLPELTNNHDRCRLFHLLVLGSAQVTWAAALTLVNREKPDVETLRRRAYEDLAIMFNDYTKTQFRNVCIVYDDDGIAISPYVPKAGVEAIADRCWDLNPNDSNRPVRNGSWIEMVSKELRRTMTNVYKRYRMCGNQEAENRYTEFLKFTTNISKVYAYAYVLMPQDLLSRLSKRIDLPRQCDADRCRAICTTCMEGSENCPRKRRRRTRIHTSSNSFSNKLCRENMLESAMKAAANSRLQQAALIFFANGADPVQRDRAIAILARRAFGNDANDHKQGSN